MRVKYYVRGIGVGLIVATLILMISFSFSDKNQMSDEDIMARASELGMVMPEEELDESKLPEDLDENDDTEETEKSETVDDNSSENVISNEDQVVKEETNENAKNEDNVANESDDSDTSVTYVAFTIASGQSSNDVAANLQKAGLVDDADSFNAYLNKIGVDDLIQAGTFYVASDSTYDDLAAILVTKQDKRTTTPPGKTD